MSPGRVIAALAVLLLIALPGAAHAVGDYPMTIAAGGPAAYWPLDEAPGATTLRDSVTQTTATKPSGVTLGGLAGVAAGGTSVTLAGSPSIDFRSLNVVTADRTVEAWVAPTTTSGNRYVISKGGSSSGFHLYLAAGVPVFQVNGSRVTSPRAIPSRGWHHVAATLSTRAMVLYVDGEQVATATLANTPASSGNLYLGRYSGSRSGFFQGGLDELALYGRALTAAEVAAHYETGVDRAPPQIAVTSAPQGVSERPDGTVAFGSSKAGTTFTCALDDDAAKACAGSFAYDLLRDGEHTLSIVAHDRWGFSATTEHSWQVALPAAELAAPVTTLTSTPASLTNSTSARFAFTGSKTRVTFACRLDGGPWTPCAGTAAYDNLSEGTHNLEVRATDRWGTGEAAPRSFAWRIDLTPPETFVLAAKATLADPGSAVVGSEEGASFECRWADSEWRPCLAAFALPKTDAPGQLTVRATDAAGNADPSPAAIVVDPAPAEAPVAFAGGQARFVIGGNRAVTGLTCSLDHAAPAKCPWPLELEGLGYGKHTLTVTDPSLPGVVFPTITWGTPLPTPRIAGSQFPALLQLGSHRRQASLAANRLPRLLFQSNSAGEAKVTLRRGTKTVRRWKAAVLQGSNLVRLPRAAWKRLRPGRYGLTVVVTNASGGSEPLRLRFDAVRIPRR